MGLLKVGKPKRWDASQLNLKYIRNAGIRQFISTHKVGDEKQIKDTRTLTLPPPTSHANESRSPPPANETNTRPPPHSGSRP